MPSPKNVRKDASRKASEKAEAKELDLGQKLSRRKSQDFKSKIELWDLTGAVGEQQPEPERIINEATPSPKKENNARAKPTKDPDAFDVSGAVETLGRKVSREVDLEKKAWVRRRTRTQPSSLLAKIDASPDLTKTPLPVQPKRAAPATIKVPKTAIEENLPVTKRSLTPKRRVVSDEHWRKDRPKQMDGEAKERTGREDTPKPKVVRRSVANLGLKVPPSVHNFKDIPEPPQALRRQLRRHDRSRSPSREREDDRVATPDYESSGTKVYIKRRRRSKPSDDRAADRATVSTSESSFTEPRLVGRLASATETTSPEMTPTRYQAQRSSTDPHVKVRRFMKSQAHPDHLEDAHTPTRGLQPEPDNPHRGNNKKSKMLRRSLERPNSAEKPQQSGPKVHGSRIEGWLATMSDDPFTEPEASLRAPERLELSHEALSHHNSDMNSSDDEELQRRVVRGERPIPRPDDPDEYEMLATSHSLKRHVARRSPRPVMPGRDLEPMDSRETGLQSATAERIRRPLQRMERNDVRDRYPPGTGHRLSTIPSASTLREQRTIRPDESVLSRASEGDEPARHGTVMRSRRTKHSDLMSVLSLPREDDHALAPARSIRTRRPRHDLTTAGDLMNEVTTDELKYQRELRTLVDGVIPVLLQYVLAQSNNSNQRRGFSNGDTSLTQPIVDMGVALERLKACHKRIPMHDPNELLLWADNAARVYSAYIHVWRLGFNDVVVNLAPAEEKTRSELSAWDDGLQRNEHGDLLDGDGERVDVAYLLKRPLVRVRDLSKTLKGVSHIRPSLFADDVSSTYEDLVSRAKQRTNDERARLEDEAASAIDPTRARDPCSLAPLAGVRIDRSRRVSARDFFDLEFFHSTGQQINCSIEIIMRDDPPERTSAMGDILICEISPGGRWLLFPPLPASSVSSRYGDRDGEVVIMIRGRCMDGTEWRELLSIQSSPEQSTEWVEMLGTQPAPPRLTRRSSFNTMHHPRMQRSFGALPSGSDLPIGERATSSAPEWDGSEVNSEVHGMSRPGLPEIRPPKSRGVLSTPQHEENAPRGRMPFETNHAQLLARPSGAYPTSAGRRHARSASEWIPGDSTGKKKAYGDLSPSWDRQISPEHNKDDDVHSQQRPILERRTSSVPSMDLPTVHKVRKVSTPEPPGAFPDVQPPRTPQPTSFAAREPTSAPAKLQKRSTPATAEVDNRTDPHADRTTPPRVRAIGAVPSFTPAFLQKPRRSSSPLKHEYEPSTATESSDNEYSDAEDDESITSESSAEGAVSTLGELRDFKNFVPMRQYVQPRPPESHYSTDAETIRPSESASLAPYRTVPTSTRGLAKSVACLFSWCDNGTWQSIHPEECQIFVTPGLIEAFDLAQASAVAVHAGIADERSPSLMGVKPLIALELTPWVPLRRGTAVDISIRSPPTANSVLRNGSNTMFRSRSPEDCERLYNLINRARIDNPTWMALQNARNPGQTSNWGEVMDHRNAARPDSNNTSWLKSLSRKGSTYRSKGTRSISIAASQSSIGTVNTAFSAIRQFSGGSKIFNIAKSTITSKRSTHSSHSDSLSSGMATPHPVDTSMGTPVGITNTKIRLYVRESTTKWRDLGNAHLTVMLPPRREQSGPADPRTTGLEKRILVCGKKENVILDVTLGETCFERVARTGIAVSVWEEDIGPNGEVGYAAATGGVATSRSTVYMIQMKSEREAAFTFSMVGKLRY